MPNSTIPTLEFLRNGPMNRGGSLDISESKAPDDPVQETSEESFPASDPPAWTPMTGLGPPA